MNMIKILITDDNPGIRVGVKQLISDEDEMMVSGEAETGMQTMDLLKKNFYDLLILDVNLPDTNGFEILKNINISEIPIPVLILTVLPDEQFAAKMIEAGASGYLNKMDASDNLICAIKKVMNGECYFKSSLSEELISSIRKVKGKNRSEKLQA